MLKLVNSIKLNKNNTLCEFDNGEVYVRNVNDQGGSMWCCDENTTREHPPLSQGGCDKLEQAYQESVNLVEKANGAPSTAPETTGAGLTDLEKNTALRLDLLEFAVKNLCDAAKKQKDSNTYPVRYPYPVRYEGLASGTLNGLLGNKAVPKAAEPCSCPLCKSFACDNSFTISDLLNQVLGKIDKLAPDIEKCPCEKCEKERAEESLEKFFDRMMGK